MSKSSNLNCSAQQQQQQFSSRSHMHAMADRPQDMRQNSQSAEMQHMQQERKGQGSQHARSEMRRNYDQSRQQTYPQQYQKGMPPIDDQQQQQHQPPLTKIPGSGPNPNATSSHKKQMRGKRSQHPGNYAQQQYGGGGGGSHPREIPPYQMKGGGGAAEYGATADQGSQQELKGSQQSQQQQQMQQQSQQQTSQGPYGNDIVEDNQDFVDQDEQAKIMAQILQLQNRLKQVQQSQNAPISSSQGNTDVTNRQSPSTMMTDQHQLRNENANKFSPSLRSKESKKGKYPSPQRQQKMSPKQPQSEMQKHDGEELVQTGNETRLVQSPPIKGGAHQHSLEKIRNRGGGGGGGASHLENNESSGDLLMDKKYHNQIANRDLPGDEEIDMQLNSYKESGGNRRKIMPEHREPDESRATMPSRHSQKQHSQRHLEKQQQQLASENPDMIDYKLRHEQHRGHHAQPIEPESPDRDARHMAIHDDQFIRDSLRDGRQNIDECQAGNVHLSQGHRIRMQNRHPRDGTDYHLKQQMISRSGPQFEDSIDNSRRIHQGHIQQEDAVDECSGKLDELIPSQNQIMSRRKIHREPPGSIFRSNAPGQSQKYGGGRHTGGHNEGPGMRGEPMDYEEDFVNQNNHLDLQQDEFEPTNETGSRNIDFTLNEDQAIDCGPTEDGTHEPEYEGRNPQSQDMGEMTLNEEGTQQQPLEDCHLAEVMQHTEEVSYNQDEFSNEMYIGEDQEVMPVGQKKFHNQGPKEVMMPNNQYNYQYANKQHQMNQMAPENEDYDQEEDQEILDEELVHHDQDENEDAVSILHSQYYQDRQDCTATSQIHYDDNGEDQGYDLQEDDGFQHSHPRDDESEYSNDQTQDNIRDDNYSQGSQVLEDHDGQGEYLYNEGPNHQGYEDEMVQEREQMTRDSYNEDQINQEEHFHDMELVDHQQHHQQHQYMDDNDEMGHHHRDDQNEYIEDNQPDIARIDIQEDPMTFNRHQEENSKILAQDDIEEGNDPFGVVDIEGEAGVVDNNEPQIPLIIIQDNVTSFQILRIHKHKPMLPPPNGEVINEQDLQFLCLIDLVTDMDDMQDNFPQVKRITSWLSIQRIMESDGQLNQVHLRMYCEGKGLTFNGIEQIECGDQLAREDHSNSRYTNEDYGEENNSHYTAGEQESNLPSSADINTTQAGTVAPGGVSAVTVNTVSNLSGTTSAVASASAAPSTIRDMTLPPLSDHASENFGRQHDVTITASMQPYGTEGPSNENTLQYDTKNPFTSMTMNRSVQGNCTDDRSSSLQSKGNDNFMSSNGGVEAPPPCLLRDDGRYRDRPSFVKGQGPDSYQEQIIKENCLNSGASEHQHQQKKQRRDSTEHHDLLQQSDDDFAPLDGEEPTGKKTRHVHSHKSSKQSSQQDEGLLLDSSTGPLVPRTHLGRKRGSTRKISDDDDDDRQFPQLKVKNLARRHSSHHQLVDSDDGDGNDLVAPSNKQLVGGSDRENSEQNNNNRYGSGGGPAGKQLLRDEERLASMAAAGAVERGASAKDPPATATDRHNKFIRQTRSGRQSKKPANFDQYSASQNHDSRKGDYEEEKEEYYGSYRNSQKPIKKVNYRYGQHHEQQNSERAFNSRMSKMMGRGGGCGGGGRDDQIDNISNRSSESEYMTNERQPRTQKPEKKDELLGFVSSSNQTDSKKENGLDAKHDTGIGEQMMTRRGSMLKKELEIELKQAKSGYYTTTPEPNKGNVRLGRKRQRHADLIEEEDGEKSEEDGEQEDEEEQDEENQHPNRYKKKRATWLQRANQKQQIVKSKLMNMDEDRDGFKRRIIKEKRRIKKFGQRIMQQKIYGSYDKKHQAMRIRSIRNTMKGDIKEEVAKLKKERNKADSEDLDQSGTGYGEEAGNTTSTFTYPYQAILCTIEWHDMITNDNKKVKLEDSKVSYDELRMRDPKLLCDFFERHLQFV